MRHKKKSSHVLAICICLLVITGVLIDMYQQDYWPPFAGHRVDADQNQSELSDPVDLSSESSEHQNQTDYDLDQPTADLEDSGYSNEEENIPVYLVGAVHNPGIYLVEPGIYLYELVELAGGLTEEAAADQINLVMQISINRQIYIPTQEEVQNNPQLLPKETDETVTGSHGIPLININQASQKELEQLPGVGPVTAKAIINYREKNGPFANPEAIMQVTGIKENRFSALRDFIYTN